MGYIDDNLNANGYTTTCGVGVTRTKNLDWECTRQTAPLLAALLRTLRHIYVAKNMNF